MCFIACHSLGIFFRPGTALFFTFAADEKVVDLSFIPCNGNGKLLPLLQRGLL